MVALSDEERAARARQVAEFFHMGLSDQQIADQMCLSNRVIGQIRRECRLMRTFGAPVNNENILRVRKLHDLGLPDPEIARQTGISAPSVRKYRRSMGLGAHRVPEWRMKQRLGMIADCHRQGLTDEQAAARIGIRDDHARKLRCKLGLCPNVEVPPVASALKDAPLTAAEACAVDGLRNLFRTTRPAISEALAGRIMAAHVDRGFRV